MYDLYGAPHSKQIWDFPVFVVSCTVFVVLVGLKGEQFLHGFCFFVDIINIYVILLLKLCMNSDSYRCINGRKGYVTTARLITFVYFHYLVFSLCHVDRTDLLIHI